MQASETTPLTYSNSSSSYPSSTLSTAEESSEESDVEDNENNLKGEVSEEDILGRKLIACNNNEELECLVIRRSLDISFHPPGSSATRSRFPKLAGMTHRFTSSRRTRKEDQSLFQKMVVMVSLALLGLLIIFVLLEVSSIVIGPPSEPIGPYKLVEVQVGEDFFNHYVFYNGLDSEGSKGYVSYVSKDQAFELNIANVTWEDADPSIYCGNSSDAMQENTMKIQNESLKEPFVYMSTSPTDAGPRNSVRLEGLRRFNRGLFILDLRHMPAGCATWPAFWLTDEPNWPVNGEIDILEGVNMQTEAKTAMHTTKGCDMYDVPLGVSTGYWDTAVGVPKKNGDLDMTVREARNCFVYDPHQWLNQGCVAINDEDGTIGVPLNEKGGGVFVLEWDPINRFIKSWVFAPHSNVPDNLRRSIESANDKESTNKVRPDPRTWGLPYAYFPIGVGTGCDANHFRNMHLIFNLALCGSVAGNRFFLDCPDLKKEYGTCENYVKANTPSMDDVYWKIRGVYVYQREWERSWVN
mmetsp:Transcript_5479/g.10444  ORF Transcript_5479/g.10444 Transcript_5479/m.10444 type:complete len:524 (-) Transcript_5479:2313-3884(-)